MSGVDDDSQAAAQTDRKLSKSKNLRRKYSEIESDSDEESAVATESTSTTFRAKRRKSNDNDLQEDVTMQENQSEESVVPPSDVSLVTNTTDIPVTVSSVPETSEPIIINRQSLEAPAHIQSGVIRQDTHAANPVVSVEHQSKLERAVQKRPVRQEEILTLIEPTEKQISDNQQNTLHEQVEEEDTTTDIANSWLMQVYLVGHELFHFFYDNRLSFLVLIVLILSLFIFNGELPESERQIAQFTPPPFVPEPQQQGNDELEQKVEELTLKLEELGTQVKSYLDKIPEKSEPSITVINNEINVAENEDLQHLIAKMINNALDLYSADKINKADYALKSMGAEIISHSPTYNYMNIYWRNFPTSVHNYLFKKPNPPETILEPDISLGKCWAFEGSSGYAVVRLPQPIFPESFSIDHVPESLAPDFRSAPKKISIIGYQKEGSEAETLVTGEYDLNKGIVQNFAVDSRKTTTKAYSLFMLRVHSNQGNSNYTCIYRFRVHGKRDVDAAY